MQRQSWRGGCGWSISVGGGDVPRAQDDVPVLTYTTMEAYYSQRDCLFQGKTDPGILHSDIPGKALGPGHPTKRFDGFTEKKTKREKPHKK